MDFSLREDELDTAVTVLKWLLCSEKFLDCTPEFRQAVIGFVNKSQRVLNAEACRRSGIRPD